MVGDRPGFPFVALFLPSEFYLSLRLAVQKQRDPRHKACVVCTARDLVPRLRNVQ